MDLALGRPFGPKNGVEKAPETSLLHEPLVRFGGWESFARLGPGVKVESRRYLLLPTMEELWASNVFKMFNCNRSAALVRGF